MLKNIIYISLFLLVFFDAKAQRAPFMERDTVFLEEFLGKERFQYIMKDAQLIKHGSYTFNSQLFNQVLSKNLNQLQIKGNYVEGRFHGLWEYKLSELELEIKGIGEGRNVVLDYSLEGVDRIGKFNYKLGVPDGNWRIDNVTIKQNRRLSETNGGSIDFKDGVAVGSISFDGLRSRNFLKGNLNEFGFFDGELVIEYTKNNVRIKEVRTYNNGFLVKLVKSGPNTPEDIVNITYSDVVSKLDDADGRIEGINFTISDEGFGVSFQNGYNEDDEKLMEQKDGNEILLDVLSRFKRFAKDLPDEREEPLFNLTRRFKYIYPENEDSIIRFMEPKLKIILDEYNSFLSNPKFILNKQRIDSLPYIFGYIDHARRKAQDMLDVVNLVNEGFFDFLYRPNYFPNGLPNLNKPDKFTYLDNGKEVEAEFDLGVYVDSPTNIITQIDDFSEILRERTDQFLEYSFMEIRIFDEQATIDSLDNLIVQLRTKTDALYSIFQVIPEGKSFDEMPLDYRIYRVLQNNLLQKLQNDYLDAEIFENKVQLGEEFTCILSVLAEEFDVIIDIENLPSRLDKEFTRYSPNPFFERDIETKILQGIYNKGTGPLYNEYITDLFSSRNCKELINHLRKFERLEERLLELVNDSDNAEVGRLDRALRRENVPSRIERLLNL
jgi:hypothetical protein